MAAQFTTTLCVAYCNGSRRLPHYSQILARKVALDRPTHAVPSGAPVESSHSTISESGLRWKVFCLYNIYILW